MLKAAGVTQAKNLAPGLELALSWNGSTISGARIEAPRPQAARIFAGRPATAVAALAPRLFSLCAIAQGCAARRALAAACASPLAEPDDAERDALTREMSGEHLWRLCLDWPAGLGLESRPQVLGAWRRGTPLEERPQWRHFETLALELPAAATPGVALLELMDAQGFWDSLPYEQGWDCLSDHAMAPTLAGTPREVGAAARWRQHPEVAALWRQDRRQTARLLCRCLELEALQAGHWDPAWVQEFSPRPGIGLARVETARGPLLHLAEVRDGKVVRYVIVAPTEWNFHPAGALVCDAAGLAAASADAAREAASLLALSLDPCVAVEITLESRHHA